MMSESTITVVGSHNYSVGDEIELVTPDTRKWKRLWHFVTFRPPPTKSERFKITGSQLTTLKVNS